MNSAPQLQTPAGIAGLPLDASGRTVPYYATGISPYEAPWITRVRAARQACRKRLCYTCGRALADPVAFTLDPAALITRAAPEPPSHPLCAEYAVTGRLAVNHPAMHRQGFTEEDDDFTTEDTPGPGHGTVAVYVTGTWAPHLHRLTYGLGEPAEAVWWHAGRPATYLEALDALQRARAALLQQPATDTARLQRQYAAASQHLPGGAL